jgi:quinoprotein glucose dehydrogenase
MKGSPPEFPSLIDLKKRMGVYDVTRLLYYGNGRMPIFRSLGSEQITALAKYVVQNSDGTLSHTSDAKPDPNLSRRFTINGYQRFSDPDGYPAAKPPWGTLSAIDLATGNYLWRIPFGEYPELAATGLKNTGSENYGGAVVTAGGLLFIGATIFDNKFRAFDKKSGKLLWETVLPASAVATPATYEIGGRQFVVVAVGGGKNAKVKTQAIYMAFALPPGKSH